MRFEEPQRLVERARIGGEDVGGVGIARLIGLVDPGACRIRDLAVALDQRREVVFDQFRRFGAYVKEVLAKSAA